MTIQTKLFGNIAVDNEKTIHFENGIIGFPDMKNYLIIYDEEKGDKAKISWLQSIEEPGFAIPVINPLLVRMDYNPTVNDELMKPLGDLDPQEMLVLVTMTIPAEVKNMTVNLKAPIVINAITRKACQIVVENEEYLVKYPVYDILKSKQEKAGE
ncbi:flagellar assembly factor FliW [Lachnotalea glycerini]|jgi:flagellar assembly factor FliW|uniref:Flagellar assembly factor FliW n=1 Tax=Lachnotalea glycerini TaxID=1763509 RepID=A0A255II70_9FIRM|nr:flagellar assembly protein FliW [Lachnotalea glycerini]PXV90222.1 flagellar assembly factor FliW [Lachnotalea glycerini]RDY30619.1 flagellar assembly protein FliW [Lachnotalea glycerini]